MINKNNELPSFVNETNLPKIIDKLTDAKNIKISNNKYGNRVQTVVDKIVEKADDVTKAIKQEVENDSYSFKVGTGNVDVSADVEDGFGEVGVKGITYQNLYPQLNTKNYYDKYGGIQFDRDIIKFTANGSYQNIFLKKEALIVKPNTTYTLIIDILKNTIVNEQDDSMLLFLETSKESNQLSYFNERIRLNKNDDIGRYEFVVTTKSDFSVSSYATRCFLNIKATSGELWIKYCILEGDHTNNPNLPSYFEGIVGVGDKSKNLFNGKTRNGYYSNGVFTANSSNLANAEPIKIKPNTYYSGSGDALPRMTFYDKDMNFISYHTTTPILSPSNACYLNIHAMGATYFQIEEGSVATSYEPYYGGHKIEILSNGKNLFNESKHLFNVSIGSESAKKWGTGKGGNRWSLKAPCKPNTTYTITKTGGDRLGVWTNSFDFDGNKEQELDNLVANTIENNPFTFTTPSNAKVICIYLSLNEESTNIHLEESPTPTLYTPYVEDKTQILLDEPLMRLPNGVCDEITRDGKLIRRVGKSVLDGSEHWTHYSTAPITDTNMLFSCELGFRAKGSRNLYCNHFLSTGAWNDVGSEGIQIGRNNFSGYDIRVNKSRLSTQDVAGFKNWLSQNPTTVYFELAEPIITELPTPYLRIFKGGHLTFNTLVAPESTHVVQLNKSAQIQNAIKESQSLDNRINVLENNYDNLMLSTISRLNDLEFNYTLK